MPFILPAHTGLRALAALMVVFFHFSFFNAVSNPLAQGLFANGYLGVDLFFVLSGFIIHHVYRTKIDAENLKAKFGPFLRYRLARIYPVHLAVLLALVAFQIVGWLVSGRPIESDAYSIGGVLSSLLLVHGWFSIPAPNYVSWSVSAEWSAYLLYPVALAYGMRLRPLAQGAAFAALLVALQFWEASPLLRIVPEFAVGVVAYEVARRHASKLQAFRWAGLLSLVAAALMIATFQAVMILPLCIAFGALLIALVNPRDHLALVLSGAVFIYLGEISYSLYMVHSPLRDILRRVFARLDLDIAATPGMIVSVVSALMLAALIYHTVEMPARRILRGRKAGIPQETTLIPLNGSPALQAGLVPRDGTFG